MGPVSGIAFVTTVNLTTTSAVVGILVGLTTILTTGFFILRWIIKSVINDGLHENNNATREVLHQVKNSHKTNLRSDIDNVMQEAVSAKLAAADAKDAAASATAATFRIEKAVHTNAGILKEHVEAAAELISKGHERETFMTHRTEQLEQAISDLSSAIKSVSTSTPLQTHEETQ